MNLIDAKKMIKYILASSISLCFVFASSYVAAFGAACDGKKVHSNHLESVSAHGNVVVVGGKPSYSGITMRAIDSNSGVEIWRARAHFSLLSLINPNVHLGFPRDVKVVGDYVFSAGTDGRIEKRQLSTGELVWSQKLSHDALWKISFRDSIAFLASRDGRIIGFDISGREVIFDVYRHDALVRSVLYLPEVDGLMSSGADGVVTMNDASTGVLKWQLRFPVTVKTKAVLDDTLYVALWSENKPDIVAYDLNTFERKWSWSFHDYSLPGFRGSHQGIEEMVLYRNWLFTGGDDGYLMKADIRSRSVVGSVQGSGMSVRAVSVSDNHVFFVDRGGWLGMCQL